jgi:carbon storage regulator
MLILTRYVGDSIMIGDNIYLTVLGVHGKQIRLGIKAPREIQILREELVEKSNVNSATSNHSTEFCASDLLY